MLDKKQKSYDDSGTTKQKVYLESFCEIVKGKHQTGYDLLNL